MNIELLRAIANATAANTVVFVSQADGLPLLRHEPPLIAVDVNQKDPSDNSKVAAVITEAGAEMLNSGNQTKPMQSFGIMDGGFVRPKSKRGGGGGHGAPAKYPFDSLGIGQFFFVANSEVSKGDAFKTLGSAVGSANQRYAEDTGLTEQKTRAKRGADHKTVKDHQGKNVMETVTLPIKKQTRKFAVSKVEAGKVYGQFIAPSDGAVVIREPLKA